MTKAKTLEITIEELETLREVLDNEISFERLEWGEEEESLSYLEVLSRLLATIEQLLTP